METAIHLLYGMSIGLGTVCLAAYVQSKSGGERAIKYRTRMKAAGILGLVALGLALVGELLQRMN